MAPRMTRAAARAQAAAKDDVHVDDDKPDAIANASESAAELKESHSSDEEAHTTTELGLDHNVLDTTSPEINTTETPTEPNVSDAIAVNVDSGSFERATIDDHNKPALSQEKDATAEREDTEPHRPSVEAAGAIQHLESLFQVPSHREANEEATVEVISSRRGSTLPSEASKEIDSSDLVSGEAVAAPQDERIDSGHASNGSSASTMEGEEVSTDDQEVPRREEKRLEHAGMDDSSEGGVTMMDIQPNSTTNDAHHEQPHPREGKSQKPIPSDQPSTQKTTSDARQPTSKERARTKSDVRTSSVPPRAIKSDKPVTKSTFQLPGEAIAAKLKAQREERLRRAEEEEKKRKEFKARPIMKTAKPMEIKATLTSRARMSLMHERLQDDSKPVDVIANRSKPLSRPSLPAGVRVTPGRPSFAASVGPGRGTASPLARSSTTSRHRTSGRKSLSASSTWQSPKPNITAKTASTGKENINNNPAPKQSIRATGAEVFRRPILEKAAAEKALQEKITAQKQARQAAAERSKNLARAFAEKKKSASQASSRNVSAGAVGNGTSVVKEAEAEHVGTAGFEGGYY